MSEGPEHQRTEGRERVRGEIAIFSGRKRQNKKFRTCVGRHQQLDLRPRRSAYHEHRFGLPPHRRVKTCEHISIIAGSRKKQNASIT